MRDLLLLSIFFLAMMMSVVFLIMHRRKENITGFKSLLTSFCFYGIAVLNVAAYYFHFLGLATFTMTFILLLLAAYFMKHLPRKEGQDEI